jgi:cytochrome b
MGYSGMQERTIRVWDLPTRIAHWSLAALLLASIASVKIGGNAMVWHGRFGLAIVGVVVFRIVWGVVGSTYARFAHFVPRPGSISAYLAGKWRGVGHNPLGALSVLALLGLVSFQAVAGLFANDDVAFYGPLYVLISSDFSNLISGWHRNAEFIVYALVGVHVGAVLFYLHVKKDNLIRPMITGMRVVDDPSIESARGGNVFSLIGALVLAGLAVWAASGGFLPPPPPPAAVPAW